MRRLCILLFCCFAVLLNSGIPVFAGEISEEMVGVISGNLDNIFPLSAKKEGFDLPVGESRGDLGPATAMIAGTADGTRNFFFYANADGATNYNYEEKLNTGSLKNFCYSIDVTVNDLYPEGEGGCGVGYVNDALGYTTDTEVLSTGLLVSDAVYLETHHKDERPHEFVKLASLDKNEVRLTIVRLMGETFFYADDEFIGQFHDGKQGPFQLFYGMEAFRNGEAAECSFDNIEIRKVVP